MKISVKVIIFIKNETINKIKSFVWMQTLITVMLS